MAVNKMKKLTLITERQHEDALLQVIQATQAIEVKEIQEEAVADMFPDELEWDSDSYAERLSSHQALLEAIMSSLLILEREVGSGSGGFKRSELTLEELEQQYDDERIVHYTQTILALKDKLTAIEEERKGLNEEEARLVRWRSLDVSPQAYTDMAYCDIRIGSLNLSNQPDFLAAVQQLGTVYCEEVYLSARHGYYFLISLVSERQAVQRLLSAVSFDVYDYTYDVRPEEAYQSVKDRLVLLRQLEKEVKKELTDCIQWQTALYLAEERVRAQIRREEVKEHLFLSPEIMMLQGWIPEKDVPVLEDGIAKQFQANDVYILLESPTQQEISEDIPTQLSNNKLVAPFEMLTEMYSLPKYDEVDPTPIMTPFYLTFFGMMVADVGYGLLLLAATFIAGKLYVLPKSTDRFMKLFQMLSVPVIVWGAIYGSFFGAAFYDYLPTGPLPLPLLSTTTDVNQILLLSVAFGFIQLMVGLLVNGVQLVKQRKYAESVSEGFAWQGLLLGIVTALLANMLLDNQLLLMLGIVVAVISAVSIVFVPMFSHPSKLKGLAKGLYGLYGITGYIGDLVSYTRLMALGISGGSIAAAFNMIVGFMPPAARFTIGIVLLVVLHVLNLLLSLLSAYVHGIRLQYVEFFGKFYTGGGRAFKPLKTEEKYVNIERKND